MRCIIFGKRDIRYFKLAKSASEMSDFGKQAIGAVITYKGHVVSSAWNTSRTSPLQKHYNQFRRMQGGNIQHKLHAEIHALSKIKNLDIDPRKLNIYVYREHKSGIRACAKPCPSCQKALIDAGIKNVYYTDEDSYCHQVY